MPLRGSVGPSYKWQLVGMLWAASFFNYADRQAIFSVFPLLQEQLHLSLVQLGLLGSAFAWVYGLCAPVAGLIVDRVRRKSAVLGGLQLWSWICMATALASRFPALLLLRAAEGLGESFYFPASLSMLGDYHTGRTRSRAFGLHQTSVYAGTIAGGFVAGWLALHYGWRSPFVIFGAAGVVLSLLLWPALIEPKRAQAAAPEHSSAKRPGMRAFLHMAVGNPALLLLMGAFSCANFVAVVLLTWMPDFLYTRFHMNLALAGLSATLFAQLGSMAGAAVGGWQADRLQRTRANGRVLVQAAGVFCGAPFVVLCGLTHSVTTLLIALASWGFFKGLYDANIFAAAFDVVPVSMRGITTGSMNTVGWLAGGSLGPLAVGLVASTRGLGDAIALTAFIYLLAGVLLLAAAHRNSLKPAENMPAKA